MKYLLILILILVVKSGECQLQFKSKCETTCVNMDSLDRIVNVYYDVSKLYEILRINDEESNSVGNWDKNISKQYIYYCDLFWKSVKYRMKVFPYNTDEINGNIDSLLHQIPKKKLFTEEKYKAVFGAY